MAAFQKMTFVGENGQELAARLDLPAAKPRAYALFAHCFTCTKDIYAASRISAGLTNEGIAVLRFDFTGLGSSEGEFENTNFSSNIADLLAAANHMRDTLEAPQIMIGHSLGGAAVLAAAGNVPECKAVATIGAPADPAHVSHNFDSAIDEINEEGIAEVLLAGRPFTIKKQFLDDIAQQNLKTKIQSLNKALLVMHAPLDNTVGVENAAVIFQAAKHPKSYISLDDADHLVSKKSDAAYAASLISAWANKYIDPIDENLPTAQKNTVTVAETGTGKFTNHVVTGSGHRWLADEPASVGGNNSGPTPYDMLLAALGACKSMTMRMYANRKKFDLEDVSVTLSHQKIHAEDCDACETSSGMIDEISTEIDIKGNLTDEERQKIFEIAERCPVHKTISGEIIIKAAMK